MILRGLCFFNNVYSISFNFFVIGWYMGMKV